MILSFHPCVNADVHIICAGRDPGENDLAAIRSAHAVILPQGCTEALYRMASENCRHVFPCYDARFQFPGKRGQIRLFRETGVPFPDTQTFRHVDAYTEAYPDTRQLFRRFQLPLVFKFDWGGEGETVFLIQSHAELTAMIEKAAGFERVGQRGFMIQARIESPPRVLRVAVIGRTFISYWRVSRDQLSFKAGLSEQGYIDRDSDPDIQRQAASAAKVFCEQTKINLAGFDFLVATDPRNAQPLFLEINYFFGRKGLGGSDRFYELLNAEVDQWVLNLPDDSG